MRVDVEGNSFSSYEAANEPNAISCPGGNDRWGIPSNGTTPQITTIIATVPDPTREHLALDFDHTIDGLLQAAIDNQYLESYSWLPWKSPGENGNTTEQEMETERKRLKEPGLIVLKYFSQSRSKGEMGERYYKVVYLFLVGNTPVEGVEGDQLANALKYEAELQNEKGVCFSPSVLQSGEECATATTSGRALHSEPSFQGEPKTQFRPSRDALTVIGPNFSGAAGSLRAQLESALEKGPSKHLFPSGVQGIHVFAEVGSQAAVNSLASSDLIHFVSFAGNAQFETEKLKQLTCDRSGGIRTVVLVEDNTVFGASQQSTTTNPASVQSTIKPCTNWQIIKFPRGISLLRNAHEEEPAQTGKESGPTPSPYLHMSLADRSDKGTIPQFSPQTAPSQEAQLVAITQQLQRSRAQLVVINGSNALDTIFLARFFHRTYPDARLVSFGADLLVNRDTDNQPFVGALAIDAYPLLAPMPSRLGPVFPRRPFASSVTESVYNAASFALWDENQTNGLLLANYRDIFSAKLVDPALVKTPELLYPSLWAMAVGRDAYYPVGIISPCASDIPQILPRLHSNSKSIEDCPEQILLQVANGQSHRLDELRLMLFRMSPEKQKELSKTIGLRFPFNPSLWWYLLCGAVSLGCIAHTFCMHFANFASLMMRDLAIDEMNDPSRRAVFIHIGTVTLFGMAFVVGYPIFPVLRLVTPNPAAVWVGFATLLAGSVALIYSFCRSFPYALRTDIASSRKFPRRPTDGYLLVHAIAFAAMVAIPFLWVRTCENSENHVGLFFSYRCLNPLSGVSPLLPVLLLLFGWYLWSIIQTRRLRFSEETRPRIPGSIEPGGGNFYVSDENLRTGMAGTDLPLYENLTCLFITPHLLRRLSKLKEWQIWIVLVLIYGGLLSICLFVLHPECMERLLIGHWLLSTTEYEWLFEILFFPLLLIALTGLLRMAVIWSTLRRQLLRRLEFFPIRFAFGRMSTVGWISMMRQSDLLERQRERARSLESMRQLTHHDGLRELLGTNNSVALDKTYKQAVDDRANLYQVIDNPQVRIPDAERAATVDFRKDLDIPKRNFEDKLRLTYYLEDDFAFFAQQLLEFVLMPYWNSQRIEIVEAEEHETTHARRVVPGQKEGPEFAIHPGLIKEPPLLICLAEEFVAIRYVSLIRAVLVNIRHLMTFVSFAWVLSMIAWNSYPFRPRETINLMFTLLFLTLGVGAIWVFSQMYRDVLLSRITRTEGNELGSEFYIRVAMFGAIPLLTWVAYQFPAMGAVVLKYLQPGIEAAK
jgi:hypothetical protein